jgi:hypothetical protein
MILFPKSIWLSSSDTQACSPHLESDQPNPLSPGAKLLGLLRAFCKVDGLESDAGEYFHQENQQILPGLLQPLQSQLLSISLERHCLQTLSQREREGEKTEKGRGRGRNPR